MKGMDGCLSVVVDFCDMGRYGKERGMKGIVENEGESASPPHLSWSLLARESGHDRICGIQPAQAA